jgi:DNA-binding XRE family transcriptional regulator
MPKSDKGLGQKVKDFRMEQQMTQEEAARFFRVSIATFIRIEGGKNCRDLTRARIETKIAKQLQAV